MTVSFTPDGDKIRRVAKGTYTSGKPIDEGGPEGSSFAWDGQAHVVQESSSRVEITSTPVKNRVTGVKITIDGKPVVQMVARVSPDGGTLTESSENFDSQGNISKSIVVFERQ